MAVYDSFAADGWMVFGGTSVSSPIIAGAYALAGNGKLVNDASYVYAHATGALNDVSSESNSSCGSNLCTSVSGYDGPTELGTPKGVAAF
ncbi:MAG: hypothetical protein ABR591_09890 [Candidatus Velthaea sp.]